ncbi:MAG TPA: tetratricopeptide repeat protein, partial [Bacteroidia bacterium]|nr:tetratricopeptide repeat protein [Bacteroidia bacterium]
VGRALCLGNIGTVYSRTNDTAKALEYYVRALKMDEELGNKSEVARIRLNMAFLWLDNKQRSLALHYAEEALALDNELHNNHALPFCYRALGMIKESEGDSAGEMTNRRSQGHGFYAEARKDYQQSLEISRSTGERSNIAASYASMANLDMKLNNQTGAEKLMRQSITIFDSIGELDKLRLNYQALSMILEKEKKPEEALNAYKQYASLNDSIFTQNKNKQISLTELNYTFDKKEVLRKAEEDRKGLQMEEEKHRNRIVMNSGAIVMLLMIVVGALIFRSSTQRKRANELLERKNTVIEHQKEVVEEQNKHIMDSIQYAKRIQDAILPAQLFEPGEVKEHFILFVPKDVVSGDFYWRYDSGEHLYFAVVDCTGHGVPGAMMSMMGYDVLESAVKDKGLTEPAEIL